MEISKLDADIKKMKVLITGATGYIGGKMARYLHSQNFDVVCMTRMGKKVNSLRVVEGDLLKPETLQKSCENIDIVCHFAGAMGRGLKEETIISTNVSGTESIVHAAKNAGVKFFLHISSGAVVGPRGPALANEYTECHPYTIYERTKYEGEKLALRIADKIGLPLCVVRPTFTYGPGDPHKLLMFKLIKKGLFFFIGDGSSTNHPVFIDDLIDAILLILRKRPNQEIFIIGGPRPVSKKEWAVSIAKTLKVTPPRLYIPEGLAWMGADIMETIGRIIGLELPLTHSRILAMSRYWGMDISKARRELGYSPRVDLEEGVAKTVAWYVNEGLL